MSKPTVREPQNTRLRPDDWGDPNYFVVSRNGEWAVSFHEPFSTESTPQLWHEGVPRLAFKSAARFEHQFAVSNHGYFGHVFEQKFDNENLFHHSRFVVQTPDGEVIFNKKLNALIDKIGVTHDEQVVWCLTGDSRKMQTHHNACFCVDLSSGKLIFNGHRFPGPLTDSGYDAPLEGARKLWFTGHWETAVRITKPD